MSGTALLLAAALAAPASDTLVVGLLADPVSLAPHRASDLVSAAVVLNVCETLVRPRPDGARFEPLLATSWATADGRTWTFTLRDGVGFHDGAPFDAEAVVANIELLRRKRAFPGRARRGGRLVVSIELEAPNAALLSTLSQPFFALQSPRALATSRPVGTGPFVFVDAVPGRVRLASHARYWGGRPRLGALEFRRFADEGRLLRALVSAEVDVTQALGHDRVEALHDAPGIELDFRVGSNLAFLAPNHEKAPFGDRRVRRALALAIDRPALVEHVVGGHGAAARNPLPPALWGYSPRTRELVRDLPQARRLLREAGFPDGLEAELLEPPVPRPYLPRPAELTRRLQADLAAAGVRTRRVTVRDWADYLGRASRGEFDLAVFGWQADTNDPNDFLTALLDSESIPATNRARYRSPQMDALLLRARRRSPAAERIALYHEAQELFQRDMPWAPLFHVSGVTAHRSAVSGLLLGPAALVRYEEAWKTP